MEKFNGNKKLNICIGDFKWCEYNVHIYASFIMVMKWYDQVGRQPLDSVSGLVQLVQL